VRVLVAGATGAIGKPLVERLIAGGHHVTGATRSESGAAALKAIGAEAAVFDAFDADAVRAGVAAARPDVVVHQLTALPKEAKPSPSVMKQAFAMTAKLRRETVPVFAEAARAAGARRFIAQSISFVTRPEGPSILDETAPLWLDGPSEFRETLEAVRILEDATVGTPGIEGIVLRYGFYYGAGTWYAPDGSMGHLIRRRMLPLIGDGTGIWSFVHIDDAAEATILALDRGAPGIYNITDDEPVAQNEWLPEMARLMAAKPPRRIPTFVGRLVGGEIFVHYATTLRGAANTKARREFDWKPRAWRDGFRDVFSRGAA
jgi:nucleoside-diphosphate-sugar epimerase